MSGSSSSGEEDYDPSRYPQLNADLSLPGSEKQMVNVVVTGFGPFEGHPVNASWEAVKALRQIGVAHNVNLITEMVNVDYKTVQEMVPQLWNKHKPHLVVHVGVSGMATEVTFETVAHNNGYKKNDITGSTAPSQCYNIDDGDNCLRSGIDVERLCEDVNKSGCLAMVVPSNNAGRYLCEYIYYASLSRDVTKAMFIHVPPLDCPYSADELGQALRCSVQCMLKQLGLLHQLPLPDNNVMNELHHQALHSAAGGSD